MKDRYEHMIRWRTFVPLVMVLGFVSCGPSDGPASDIGRDASATTEGVLASSATGDQAIATVSTGHEHHHASMADGPDAVAAELPGLSLYHLESEWWDQIGGRRSLASLEGRVQVVSMVYTHCAYSCPRILADLKRIESELGEAAGDRVGYVLFSIDPERDTPERLAEFAGDVRLDPDRWSVLASDDRHTLELAAILGVRFVRESPTDFAHTNMVAVLNPRGEIVHRQLGVGDVGETIAAIQGLLESD